MTSLWPQGSASSQPQATDSCSSDDQTQNDKGKRVLSQLERTAKFGRMSSEVGGRFQLTMFMYNNTYAAMNIP